MLKTVIRRILQIIPTLLVVVTLTFTITRLLPGDPVTALVSDSADPELMEQLREEMGLNDPIWEQYLNYLGDMLTGDFGKSYYYNKPAMEVIGGRLPNTMLIALTSLLFAAAVGLLLGIVSALNQYSHLDYFLTVLTLLGISLPVFWLALMLVLLFSVNLGWLPSFGMGSADSGFWSVVSHMILPCICLAVGPAAKITRMTRASVIEALNCDSITALHARGIRSRVITWKHALKNALPAILTIFAMQLAGTFSGAMLTENVFAWPGMGTMIYNAIETRDYALIQSTVVVTGIAFVVINLITDLVYMVINPKVSVKGGKE